MAGSPSSGRRVLVVDDTPSIRFLIRTNLELDGWEVIESVDGQDCLDRVGEIAPDIITIDAVMPILDGFAAAAELRRRPETAHIPIVMVTTVSHLADVRRGTQIGVDAYVVKPFDPDELVATLRRVLESHS